MDNHPAEQHLRTVLQPEEQIVIKADVEDAVIAVTDRRLAIADAHRLVMDTTFGELRRIQFDIERERPATLVIVPESASRPPQVLAVPPDRYQAVCDALALIGRQLAADAKPAS